MYVIHQTGQILLDGVDAASLDASWIRGCGAVAMVSQV
jgi:ABC-type bacteriocin/lantibiotic exporter with double-glycine peptidase domain